MRVVDLFCGMGGIAEACRGVANVRTVACHLGDKQSSSMETGSTVVPRVVAAIDIDRRIVAVYSKNHRVVPTIQAIESIQQIPSGDLWWLSPPCQPYTRRGSGRAECDPRSLALARLIRLIDRDRPERIMLENVPAFSGSQHHQQLETLLREAGYSVRADELCPTQWKVPMRRKRFYLRARKDGRPIGPVPIAPLGLPLAHYVDATAWDDQSLLVPHDVSSQYQRAMRIVDVDDSCAVVNCFTSAYGNSPVQAGSYLRSADGRLIRRFSTGEIGRLMGYREGFWWPDELDQRSRYRLLGNALSVTVVRALLETMVDPAP